MIPDQFVKYGDQYNLMSVIGMYRIYKRTSCKGFNHTACYEVMRPINMKGVMILPGASMWGIYGWTCMTEICVVKRIQKLLERDKMELEHQAGKLMTKLSDADNITQCADESAPN